jgi:transposase
MAWRKLTDKQWELVEQQLPKAKPKPKGGRPRVSDRQCFEGILWILWTGAPWSELPRQYGSPSTVWRRLRAWEEAGVFLNLWRAFLAQLNDRQKIRWDECFADGSFAPAKKGAPKSGRPNAARAQSGWFWSMARVLRWEHTWTRRPQRK